MTLLLERIGDFTSDIGAEISAYDRDRQLLYVVAGGTELQAIDLSDPAAPELVLAFDIGQYGVPIGGANSVAYSSGLLAVALEADPATEPGYVAVVDVEGAIAANEAGRDIVEAVNVLVVGALPDMLTFTPDGSKLLVANEGEAAVEVAEDGTVTVTDPEGSVSVVDVSGEFGALSQGDVSTADFRSFRGQEDALRAAGVRIFPDAEVAQDLEPEYIAVSADGTRAFVTLQENNAVAIVDVASATVESVVSLGLKDFSQSGSGLDASDRDEAINIQTQPVFGLRMPDSIAAFEAEGETFYIIANEGDDRGDADTDPRGDAIRIKDLADVTSFGREGIALDPAFEASLPADFAEDENLGRLIISSVDGDTDGDGDLDRFVSYGARSFSVLDSGGNVVFDSGDQIAQIAAELTPELFNANDGDPEEFDNRSDDKGTEPEAATAGVINGRPYGFIGLERAGGGVFVYDLSNPRQPVFVQYARSDEDIAPEGLTLISAAESATGEPLLAVANEESNTLAVYEISVDGGAGGGTGEADGEPFTLQLLHFADQEAGVPALEDAPRASAVLTALRDDFENTLTLSSGDAYIPGVFFSASEDAFGGAGRGDILIQNELGVQAIAFGNHEFDVGTGRVRDLVAGEILTADLPLEEAQQVGEMTPVDTASMGSFTASLSGNRLSVEGSFSDLTSPLLPVGGADGAGNPESSVHIHMGAAGENGPIIRNLTVEIDEDVAGAGEFSGTFDLSDDEVATLVADGLYVNLHAENNPSGELRGQIDVDLSSSANFEGAQFPYLSSNLDFSTDENLADLVVADDEAPETNSIAATTVIDVNGEQVGVVGATTPTLPSISSPGDVTVLPEDFDGQPTAAQLDALAAEIQTDVDELIAANPGLNKVVVLSHMQQLNIERELATRLTNVDIIVAGGSNTLLADETDRLRDGDTEQGVYPIVSTDANGEPVAIVNTDGNYRYIGRLVIDFDENGNIVPESYDAAVSGAYATDEAGVAALDAEGLVDPEVQAIVDRLSEVVVSKESNVFGISEVFLNGTRGDVRTQETNLGNLTAEANLAIAREADPAVVISIKNGGGIRDDIGRSIVPAGGTGEPELLPTEAIPGVKPEGGISETDIANTLRFNNGLTLLTLTATELLEIIEYGVAETSADDSVTPGRFPQVAGIEFSFDPTAAAGDRVQSLVVLDEDGNDADIVVRDGELIGAGDRAFRIVTLGFLADGGDGYPFPMRDVVDLTAAEDAPRSGAATFAPDGSEQDALAEYLAANFGADSPFDVEDTGREADSRIQNLSFREDTVIDGEMDGGPTMPPTDGGDGNPGTPTTGGPTDFLVAEEGERGALSLGDGDDFIAGNSEDNAVFGNGGSDNLQGRGGSDSLFSGSGDDLLFGGEGSDILFGEGGNDVLFGEAGDDLLRGGAGDDVLFGGEGADIFAIAPGEGVNSILDFASDDLIGLAGGLSLGQLYRVQDGNNVAVGTFAGELLAVFIDITVAQIDDAMFLSV